MKQSIIIIGTLAIAILALSSCKKDYTCECKKTYTNTDGTTTTSSHSIFTYKENRKTADDRCAKNESTGTDLGGRYTINCDIK